MKLFYFKRDAGNFGDDLNPWLWYRLIPNLEQLGTADWCVGIGTILDARLDELEGTKLILGSGVRNRGWTPAVRPDWMIGFVRGPLTAKALGLDASLAICDPALLVSLFVEPGPRDSQKVGFMPHYHTLSAFDCEQIAERSGTTLIRPDQDVDRVLAEINSCDRMICEAMHGAIVADALGVPWKRVNIFSWKKETIDVSNFKWADWAIPFGVEHSPSATSRLLPVSTKSTKWASRFAYHLHSRTIATGVSKSKQSGSYNISREIDRNAKVDLAMETISRLTS